MDAKTWNALDEREQEFELHKAEQVMTACAAADGSDEVFGRDELVHALAVLAHEDARVAALELGDGDVQRRDL